MDNKETHSNNCSVAHEIESRLSKWWYALVCFLRLQEKNAKFEEQQARTIALWVLESYLNSEHHIKKVIHPNNAQPFTTLAQIATDSATLLHIPGGWYHNENDHFWFILVRGKDKVLYSFAVQGDTSQSSLKGNSGDFTLANPMIFNEDQSKHQIRVELVLNLLLGVMLSDGLASGDLIEIVFSGSPESSESIESPELFQEPSAVPGLA